MNAGKPHGRPEFESRSAAALQERADILAQEPGPASQPVHCRPGSCQPQRDPRDLVRSSEPCGRSPGLSRDPRKAYPDPARRASGPQRRAARSWTVQGGANNGQANYGQGTAAKQHKRARLLRQMTQQRAPSPILMGNANRRPIRNPAPAGSRAGNRGAIRVGRCTGP